LVLIFFIFSSVYILDKQNSRLVKIYPTGQILTQLYNPEIGSATDFTVACVPTGMKTGVDTSPCGVFIFPSLAWQPVSLAILVNSISFA